VQSLTRLQIANAEPLIFDWTLHQCAGEGMNKARGNPVCKIGAVMASHCCKVIRGRVGTGNGYCRVSRIIVIIDSYCLGDYRAEALRRGVFGLIGPAFIFLEKRFSILSFSVRSVHLSSPSGAIVTLPDRKFSLTLRIMRACRRCASLRCPPFRRIVDRSLLCFSK
jgi:hypothetical protein